MKAKLVKESLRENIGPVDYTDSDGSGGYSTHPAYNQKPYQLEKKDIKDMKDGWDIIRYFEEIPEFKEFENPDAQYDDERYRIPVNVFTKVLDWPKEDIENAYEHLDDYEGGISWHDMLGGKPLPIEDQYISVWGGA